MPAHLSAARQSGRLLLNDGRQQDAEEGDTGDVVGEASLQFRSVELPVVLFRHEIR